MRAPHDRTPGQALDDDDAAAPGQRPRTSRLTPPRGAPTASQPATLAPAAAGPVPDMFDGILPKTSPDPSGETDGAAAKPKPGPTGLHIRWYGTTEATFRAFFHAMTRDDAVIDRWTAAIMAEHPHQLESSATEAHRVDDRDMAQVLARLHETGIMLPPSVLATLSRITGRTRERLERDAAVTNANDRDEQIMRNAIPAAASHIVGPDGVVAGGLSTFRMALSIGSEPSPDDPLEELRQITDRCTFVWEVFDVSALAGDGAGAAAASAQVAAGAPPTAGRAVTAADAHAHELARIGNQLGTDTRNAYRETAEAARVGHDADAWVGIANMLLTPTSAVRSYGGHVIERILEGVLGDKSECGIPFPSTGTFVVRCIAQPHTLDGQNARQRSVAVMVTHARSVSDVGRAALDPPAPDPRAATLATARPADVISAGIDDLAHQLSAATVARDQAGNQRDAARAAGDANAAAGFETDYVRAVELRAALRERMEVEGTRFGHARDRAALLGATTFRPRATIVDPETGAKVDLLLEVGEPSGLADLSLQAKLSDLTTADGGLYEGEVRSDRGPAMWAAVQQFAKLNHYGRGQLFVRFPDSAGLGPDSERDMPSSPGSTRLLRDRISEMTDVAMLVPGAGEVVMVAGAITASANLAQRMRDGTIDPLHPDAATINDTLQVLSALASGVKQIGSLRLDRTTSPGRALIVDVAVAVEHGSNAVQFITTTAATVETFESIAAAEENNTMSHAQAMTARLHALQGLVQVSSSLASGAIAADPVVSSDVEPPPPLAPSEPRMVPGSASQADGPVDPVAVADDANLQIVDVLRAAPGVIAVTQGEAGTGSRRRYVVTVRDGDNVSNLSIEVAVHQLGGLESSFTVVNAMRESTDLVHTGDAPAEVPIVGRYILQLSSRLRPAVEPVTSGEPLRGLAPAAAAPSGSGVAPTQPVGPTPGVRRALTHEVARLLAQRHNELVGDLPIPDLLVPGAARQALLSPRDHGRLAELQLLLDAVPGERGEQDLVAMIQHLGLREGTPGAAERMAVVERELRNPQHVERLRELSRPVDQLSDANRRLLSTVNGNALLDTLLAGNERGGEAAHPSPRRPVGAVPEDLATAAAAAVKELSARTIAAARARARELPPGRYPTVRDPMIGGGPSLAARRPDQLVVSRRQRWEVDRSAQTAQNANQLGALHDAGMGEPGEFASAGERLPLAAVRYWQDTVLAQGDFIEGNGEFSMADDGRVLLTVTPADGSAPIIYEVEVEGTALAATGFTREFVPGTRVPPAQAMAEIRARLDDYARGNDARMVEQARAVLGTIHDLAGSDATMRDLGRAIAAQPELSAAMASDPDKKPREKTPLDRAMDSVAAQTEWEALRHPADGSRPTVFLGDEANTQELRPLDSNSYVVAGIGGTAISAVEIILAGNPQARVTMVGNEPPPGLFANEQSARVLAEHLDAASAVRLGLRPNPESSGRLVIQSGYYTTSPERLPGDARGYRVGTTIGGKTKGPSFEGEVFINAIGRAGEIPSSLVPMVYGAFAREPSSVRLTPLFEESLYVGYRITITPEGHEPRAFDVTGAASRFVSEMLPGGNEVAAAITAARSLDAHADSGNFDGGYVASAVQAARYWLMRDDERSGRSSPLPAPPTNRLLNADPATLVPTMPPATAPDPAADPDVSPAR